MYNVLGEIMRQNLALRTMEQILSYALYEQPKVHVRTRGTKYFYCTILNCRLELSLRLYILVVRCELTYYNIITNWLNLFCAESTYFAVYNCILRFCVPLKIVKNQTLQILHIKYISRKYISRWSMN